MNSIKESIVLIQTFTFLIELKQCIKLDFVKVPTINLIVRMFAAYESELFSSINVLII